MAYPDRWDDITYLQHGTVRQWQAYTALVNLNIIQILKPYSPVLCGTIPLAIDLPGSDLDIVCEARDVAVFERDVSRAYSHIPSYVSRFRQKNGYPTCICNFTAEGFAFEIFGQPRPLTQIDSYRHMVVEARLLTLAGRAAAEAIRDLKAGGMKTEPAFAQYFGLNGDPYAAVLALADVPDEDLYRLICR